MKLHNETHYYSSMSIHVLSAFDFEALQSSLQEQQSGLNYLSTTVKEMSKKAPSDVSRKYQSEFEDMESRWKKLSSQLTQHCQKLEDHMAKLRKIQVIQNFTFHILLFFTCSSPNKALGNLKANNFTWSFQPCKWVQIFLRGVQFTYFFLRKW